MLPGNSLSYIPVTGLLHSPDSKRVRPLIDFERGGIDANDPSLGLLYQDWEFSYTLEGQIIVTSSSGNSHTILAVGGVTELSGTFDQNMAPVVTFVVDGVIHLNWFDTLTNSRRTDVFGEGHSPRVSLDDKRATQSSRSDVILAYIRNQTLYYRQQRDRYAVERQLKAGLSPITRLKNIGMTKNLRLLFELA